MPVAMQACVNQALSHSIHPTRSCPYTGTHNTNRLEFQHDVAEVRHMQLLLRKFWPPMLDRSCVSRLQHEVSQLRKRPQQRQTWRCSGLVDPSRRRYMYPCRLRKASRTSSILVIWVKMRALCPPVLSRCNKTASSCIAMHFYCQVKQHMPCLQGLQAQPAQLLSGHNMPAVRATCMPLLGATHCSDCQLACAPQAVQETHGTTQGSVVEVLQHSL